MKDPVPAGRAGMNTERPLPPRGQKALAEGVGVAHEDLLTRSVGVGLGVVAELMQGEVTVVVGPRGRHDPGSSGVRQGHQAGEITRGGRRVRVERAWVRAADGSGEVGLAAYQHCADRDPLSRIVLELMFAGASCRCYRGTQERPGVT